MLVKDLKKILENVPDDVNITITDMEDFETDFEIATYYEGNTYLDIIMPVYIGEYTVEEEIECNETFYDNSSLMFEFLNKTKEQFLKDNPFITDIAYNTTRDYYNVKLRGHVPYFKFLYDFIIKDIHSNLYKCELMEILEKEIKTFNIETIEEIKKQCPLLLDNV